MQVQPAEVRRPGRDGGGRERAQAGDDADEERERQNGGGAHVRGILARGEGPLQEGEHAGLVGARGERVEVLMARPRDLPVLLGFRRRREQAA